MRISFVLSSLHLSGGVRVVVEYANRLTERGYRINLVTPGGTIDPNIQEEINLAVQVYQSRISLQPGSPLNHLPLAWSLSRAVPPSDIVFSTHTPTMPSAWLAARVWQRARLFWLCQANLEMFDGHQIEHTILKWGVDRHDKILVVSEWTKRTFEPFTSQEPIVIREGISQAELFYPRPNQKHKASKSILFLGDMRPRKGLQDFLAAVELVYQDIPDIELWIVSKDRCEIETAIPFQFFYRPRRQQLAELYATCDLFVSASWWEGFGLPPLEAMACGAPVVATDSGGINEFGHHGQNCLVVPIRDPQSLSAAMITVLTDAALAGKLRQKGPPTAARFTWEAAVDRFEAALQNDAIEQPK